MALSREQFDSLVTSLEEVARENPKAYRFRVGLLAALGYAYIFLVLLLVLSLVAGVVALIVYSGRANIAVLKIALPLAVFAFLIIRALWVRFEAPEGVPLERENAVPLFQAVDRLRDALKAPAFHRILLTSDFNAAVVQVPRLGIFGWQVNYLLIGLPLMQALSPDQLRSVLAHEFGHLSGAHGRFGGWIYRINKTWQQLMESLEQDNHWGSGVFRAFFNWYAPYFAAYSFALRRSDEYIADRCAADLTGAKTTAEVLSSLPVKAEYVHGKFWPDVYRQVNTHPEPPGAPFTQLTQELQARFGAANLTASSAAPPPPPVIAGKDRESDSAQSILQRALAEKTGTTDTHPALSDRLRALGQEARLPEPVTESAAAHFFGHQLPRYAGQLDHLWRQSIERQWQERYQQAQQEQQELASLNDRAARGERLEVKEAYRRAELTEEFHSAAAALPLYQAVLEIEEGLAPVHFAVGRILLEQEDQAGIEHLERAIRLDEDATLAALEHIHAYWKRQANEAGAKAVFDRYVQQVDKLDAAGEERAQIELKARYLPHGLPEEEVGVLREQIALFEAVAEAYLVRKEVQHFPDKPLFVLGVTLAGEWRRFNRDEDAALLQQQLLSTLTFPGETFVVVLSGHNKRLGKVMRGVPGALIHRKNNRG